MHGPELVEYHDFSHQIATLDSYPSPSLYPWSAFNDIFRYHSQKTPNPFMVFYKETVYHHIFECGVFFDVFSQGYPEILDVFDFETVRRIIWVHEVDELIGGDIPLRDKLEGEQQVIHTDFGAKKSPICAPPEDHYLKSWKKGFLQSIGITNPDEINLILQQLIGFHDPLCQDPNLLLARAIDRRQGNMVVADMGNDLLQYQTTLIQVFE